MSPQRFRRNTQQRQVILAELQCLTSHPTASELYEQVRLRLPKISLGTVYRNLELLAQMGTIQKLEFSSSEARFDGIVTPHYHVRCTSCGQVDDVDHLPDDLVENTYTELNGYKIQGHRLEFLGICPGCRPQQSSNTKDVPHAVAD